MSTNTDRIPLARALLIASRLQALWKCSPDELALVGSARRQRPTVGDLEFVAAMPIAGEVATEPDKLFHTIEESVGAQGGLFGKGGRGISGMAVKGFCPGFKYCDLEIEVPEELLDGKAPGLQKIRVQIHRYIGSATLTGRVQTSNRGWIELLRTGPREFGMLFLMRWKSYWALPERMEASEGGFLRDRFGTPMDTPTEARCFELLNGWRHVPPEERDELAASMKKARGAYT